MSLIINNIRFHSSSGLMDKFPESPTMPQIAFCGRSNSGKSSLINTIVGRKDLVKVSSTPGKTRTINLFLLNEHIFLVDMPGFGYARASNDIRDSMIEVVQKYLNEISTLEVLFILCDSARDFPELERNLVITCFKKEVKPVIVLTKTDKLNQKEKSRVKKEKHQLEMDFPGIAVIHASSYSKTGIKEIQDIIGMY